MNIDDPRWDEYKEKFDELAFLADEVDKPTPPLDECRYYLCLYGENGMDAPEELAMLDKMENHLDELKKVEVETSYWQDTVLFVP